MILSTEVYSGFVNNGGHAYWLRAKAGREPFHRFVNAEICHISWWFLRISLFNVCSKDLWGLFLKKLISKAKKYEIFGKGRTLVSFKGAEQVARNPNVSENDISLINKGAKNNKLSLIFRSDSFSVGLYICKVFCGLVKSKRKKKKSEL